MPRADLTKFLVPVNDMLVHDSGFKFSIFDSMTHCPEVRKLEDVLIVQESAFKESPDLESTLWCIWSMKPSVTSPHFTSMSTKYEFHVGPALALHASVKQTHRNQPVSHKITPKWVISGRKFFVEFSQR